MAWRIEVAGKFIGKKGAKVRKVLRYAGVPRASWYAHQAKSSTPQPCSGNPKGRPVPGYDFNRDGTQIPDPVITRLLENYRSRPEFQNGGGVFKLMHYLRRDHGFYVNHKKIYRICLENRLLLKQRGRGGKRKVGFISQNRRVDGPNQLWEFDIKYGYVQGESRFFFVLAFVDGFNRKCVGRHVGLSYKKGDLCFALKEALEREGIGAEHELVIRSNNGSQMRSKQFHEYLETLERNLEHEFITPNSLQMLFYTHSR
jgi:putative transposase